MFADLPPSSCATRFTVGAARAATRVPARLEPVNDTMSTPGCAAIASPTVGPSPGTMLNTPAGTPAACIVSAHRMALNGASSDGFSTMVQPAARAGATLQTIWLTGQFHGVIRPHTPIGSRAIRVLPIGRSKAKPSSTSIMVCRCAVPDGACASRENAIGVPISSVIAWANRSSRDSYSASSRRSNATRSARRVPANAGKARCAAATARSTSVAPLSPSVTMTSSVAGFTKSNGVGAAGSTQAPSMYACAAWSMLIAPLGRGRRIPT
jgi:hypothetical protein